MNKTWLKRTLIGAAATAALTGGIAAYSHDASESEGTPHHDHHGPAMDGPAGMMVMAAHHMTLDANQQSKLQALEAVLKSQHQAFEQSGLHARMQTLIAGNTFDRAGAQQLSTDATNQIQAGSAARINAVGDFYDSLTVPQQQSLRDMLARHLRMMAMHHKASAPAN